MDALTSTVVNVTNSSLNFWESTSGILESILAFIEQTPEGVYNSPSPTRSAIVQLVRYLRGRILKFLACGWALDVLYELVLQSGPHLHLAVIIRFAIVRVNSLMAFLTERLAEIHLKYIIY